MPSMKLAIVSAVALGLAVPALAADPTPAKPVTTTAAAPISTAATPTLATAETKDSVKSEIKTETAKPEAAKVVPTTGKKKASTHKHPAKTAG